MKLRKIVLALVLIGALGLSACGARLGSNPLEGTAWELVSLDGSSPLPDSAPTLQFEDGQVGGNASCNSFGGGYQVRRDRLVFGELSSTLMACMDDGVMDQEQAYMRILSGEFQYEIADGQLFLTNPQGEMLVFKQTSSGD